MEKHPTAISLAKAIVGAEHRLTVFGSGHRLLRALYGQTLDLGVGFARSG
jgi:hypothetical protein